MSISVHHELPDLLNAGEPGTEVVSTEACGTATTHGTRMAKCGSWRMEWHRGGVRAGH